MFAVLVDAQTSGRSGITTARTTARRPPRDRYRQVAFCKPRSWKSGETLFNGDAEDPVTFDAPSYMAVKLYMNTSKTKVFTTMRGNLPKGYVTEVNSRVGTSNPPFVGHAHIGSCSDFGTSNIGVNTGAHFNKNTVDFPYGVRENEIWHTGNAKTSRRRGTARITYKSPIKDWGFPGAKGLVPSVDIDGQTAGQFGTQGTVPGAAVLHIINDDGSTGQQWACCDFIYKKSFCDDIGGCEVYDKVDMAVVEPPTY